MIHSIIAAGLFLASMFFATVCDSLRNFLRSRLAFVCRSRRNDVRFGEILRDDEWALQASEFMQLSTLLAAVLLTAFVRYHGSERNGGLPLAFDIVAAITVCWLLLDVLPWAVSRVAAEYVLYHAWPVIQATALMVNPILRIARRFDTMTHRIAGRRDPRPENLETFAEEIQSVVDEGEREGILESRAGKMIQRVMELRQEDIRTVMTPRTDIISINVSTPLAEARAQLLTAGHSRIPVVDSTPDEIVGILYARDLLEYVGPDSAHRQLKDIVRPPFYVPETTTIDALLNRMKREGLHLAIVLDEYGGVTGLVTLEDILEEIVGNIADEFDEREDALYQIIDPHTLLVDARMHLDELNDQFDLNLPEDRDFDTIGGLVFSELGRVPKQGEQLNWESLTISVVDATERKVLRVEIYNTVPWPTEETPVSS